MSCEAAAMLAWRGRLEAKASSSWKVAWFVQNQGLASICRVFMKVVRRHILVFRISLRLANYGSQHVQRHSMYHVYSVTYGLDTIWVDCGCRCCL